MRVIFLLLFYDFVLLVVLDLSYIWFLFFSFLFFFFFWRHYPISSGIYCFWWEFWCQSLSILCVVFFDLSLEVFRVFILGVLRFHKMNIREWEEQYLASWSSVPRKYRRLKTSYIEFKSLAPSPRSWVSQSSGGTWTCFLSLSVSVYSRLSLHLLCLIRCHFSIFCFPKILLASFSCAQLLYHSSVLVVLFSCILKKIASLLFDKGINEWRY